MAGSYRSDDISPHPTLSILERALPANCPIFYLPVSFYKRLIFATAFISPILCCRVVQSWPGSRCSQASKEQALQRTFLWGKRTNATVFRVTRCIYTRRRCCKV